MLNTIVRELEARNYKAEIVTVTKNGLPLTGITLSKANETTIPIFYKEDSWGDMSVREIADMLEYNYQHIAPPPVSESTIQDANFLRKHTKLCVQSKGNEDIIKRNYLDLEVYLRCFISDECSFKVKPEMEVPGLFECAVENTKADFEMKSFGPMTIATNTNTMFGASCIYFTDIFKNFCKVNNIDGCFILPSSIHELILVEEDDIFQKGNFDVMVRSTNRDVVEAKDCLADHAYYYSAIDHTITW
jgi:hypothetical protein